MQAATHPPVTATLGREHTVDEPLTTLVGLPALVNADRCDRCGAAALVRALIVNGGVLLFCGHHGKAAADSLKGKTIEIQDPKNVLAADAMSAWR